MLTIQRNRQISTVNFKSGTNDVKQIRQNLAQLAKKAEIPDDELKGDYVNFLLTNLKTAGIFRKNLRIILTDKLEALFDKQESSIEAMKNGYEQIIDSLKTEKSKLANELAQLKAGIPNKRPYKVTTVYYGDIYLTSKGLAQYNKLLPELTAAEGKRKKCNDSIKDAQDSIAVCKRYYPISAPQEMKPYESVIAAARVEIGDLDGKINYYKSQIQMLQDNGELPD